MNAIEIVSNCNIKLFQIFCIGLVIYMTYEQFLQYLKNEDSSSVSFRKFNDEKRDLYPSFSICMHSTEGAIIKKKSEFKEDPFESELYHKMLTGKMNLNVSFHGIEFDNIAVDILNEFVDMFVSYTKQGQDLNSWHRHKNSNDTPPFYLSYQDPYFRCITKSIQFVAQQILHYDYLVLNSQDFSNFTSFAKDDSSNLFLYVHHPGQLLKEFGKQSFQLNLLDFQNAMNDTHNYRELHISHVEVIRKRSDGVIPCNEALKDEDRLWIESVIQDVNCIPSYWKGLYFPTREPRLDIPECNSSKQYHDIHKHYLPPNSFEAATKLYQKPCNQMKITMNLLQKDIASPDSSLVLAFNYNTEEYRETLSYRAFGKVYRCIGVASFVC